MKNITYIFVLLLLTMFSCENKKTITLKAPHPVQPTADSIFQQTMLQASQCYDIDSSKMYVSQIDKAILLDSLNPIYYNAKAKLLIEMGEITPAFQTLLSAEKRNALDSDGSFQLGLLYQVNGDSVQARQKWEYTNAYTAEVLKQYPDSLAAFISNQLTTALLQHNDSLYLPYSKELFNRFPNRGMEIVAAKAVKPSKIVKQIKQIIHQREEEIYSQILDSIHQINQK